MAKVRTLRTSARKLNLVAASIRGKKVQRALNELEFSPKRIAIDVRKALYSAISNAENNHSLDIDSLVVAEAYRRQEPGDEALLSPRRGRRRGSRSRSAEITIVVRELARRPEWVRRSIRSAALGINRTWDSRWFADGADDYARCCTRTSRSARMLKKRLAQAGVARIIIERPHKQCRVTIYAARPGVIIGKKGADIEKLRKDLAAMTEGEVALNIVEIRKPEIDAKLVAENIAQQLERRVAFRRAMKRAMQSAMRLGAKGIRINCSGRLGGAEIARMEWYREGRVPLHTLRADIDYGVRRSPDDLWHHRRQGLDLQGRDAGARPDGAGQARRAKSGPAGNGRERTGANVERDRARRTRKEVMLQPKKTKYRKAVQGPHPRRCQGRLRR
jgi:small subunit ribosomal protein S3